MTCRRIIFGSMLKIKISFTYGVIQTLRDAEFPNFRHPSTCHAFDILKYKNDVTVTLLPLFVIIII